MFASVFHQKWKKLSLMKRLHLDEIILLLDGSLSLFDVKYFKYEF